VLAAHDIQKRVGRYVPGKTKKFEASMMQSMTPTAVFKCLADDTRSKITLLIVAQGELCVCELTAALDLSQPKISRHLALLRSAGLLMHRRQGHWVYYRLNPALPTWVTALLKDVVDANQYWLGTETTRLCGMDGRPDNQAVCS
jgi:DNA-binding transcriptional ArsR family regulator